MVMLPRRRPSASRLGISRAAVIQAVKQLEQIGYGFEQHPGLGYRWIRTPDKLYPWEIGRHLGGGNLGKRIEYLDTVDSTNSVAFRLALSGARRTHVL